MRLTGREDPKEVEEQIRVEGRDAVLPRADEGVLSSWPHEEEGYDPLPDAVAWTEAWRAAVKAAGATEIEIDVDPRYVPGWPRTLHFRWALGRHTDGGPGLWLIFMSFDNDGSVEWEALDLTENLRSAPPLELLRKVPVRVGEDTNRDAWAARDGRYKPLSLRREPARY